MSFKDIELTQEQLADLYGKQLVVINNNEAAKASQSPTNFAQEPAITAATEKPSVSSLGITGKNKKQFVWLVEEHYYPFLDDADFQFLSDVLTACKMNMDDIALVNIANNRLDFEALVLQLQPKYVIASAVQVDALPIQTADYTVQQQQGFQLCCTESLEAIRLDKTKKSKLWLALKQMLGL